MNSAKKVFLIDGEYASGTKSTNCCGAGFFFKQSHFAEELVGAHFSQQQLSIASFGNGFYLTLLYDEHAAARVILSNDDLTVFVLLSQASHINGLKQTTRSVFERDLYKYSFVYK